jgi:hypothetical protein
LFKITVDDSCTDRTTGAFNITPFISLQMASKVGSNVNATINLRIETLKTYKLRGEPKDQDEADEDKKFHFK